MKINEQVSRPTTFLIQNKLTANFFRSKITTTVQLDLIKIIQVGSNVISREFKTSLQKS